MIFILFKFSQAFSIVESNKIRNYKCKQNMNAVDNKQTEKSVEIFFFYSCEFVSFFFFFSMFKEIIQIDFILKVFLL